MKKEQFGGFIDKYRIEIISKPSWMIVESIRVFRINLCREGQKLDNNRKKRKNDDSKLWKISETNASGT